MIDLTDLKKVCDGGFLPKECCGCPILKECEAGDPAIKLNRLAGDYLRGKEDGKPNSTDN